MIKNVDQILAAADILEVIGRRVRLQRRGREYRGRCPFHNGTGESLAVNADKGTWFCWSSCKMGGDARRFLELFDKLDYPGSLEALAAECGVRVEYEQRSGTADSGPRRRDLLDAVEAATVWYQQALAAEPRALEYLTRRGFGPDLVSKWRLGYARGNGVAECGVPVEALVAAGVLVRPKIAGEKPYDPLAGRMIIPLTNPAGQPVAFCGRLIESQSPFGSGASSDNMPSTAAKYKNTSDTPIWRKGEHVFGYREAAPLARAQGCVFVLEGQLKAMAAQAAGVPAVAVGGSGMTERQAAALARLDDVVHLAYDADAAGVAATVRAAQVLRAAEIAVSVAVLEIPDQYQAPAGAKVDPDDLLARGLPIKYTLHGLIPWLIGVCGKGDRGSVEMARAVHAHVLPLVQAQPLPAVRAAELAELAAAAGLPESAFVAAPGPAQAPTAASSGNIEAQPRLTAARHLVAALLQADEDPAAASPWWQLYLDWVHLPIDLLPHLQTVWRIKRAALRRGVPVATAIEAVLPDGPRRVAYLEAAAVALPGPVDSQTIADVNRAVVEAERSRRLADAKAAAAVGGPIGPVLDEAQPQSHPGAA